MAVEAPVAHRNQPLLGSGERVQAGIGRRSGRRTQRARCRPGRRAVENLQPKRERRKKKKKDLLGLAHFKLAYEEPAPAIRSLSTTGVGHRRIAGVLTASRWRTGR